MLYHLIQPRSRRNSTLNHIALNCPGLIVCNNCTASTVLQQLHNCRGEMFGVGRIFLGLFSLKYNNRSRMSLVPFESVPMMFEQCVLSFRIGRSITTGRRRRRKAPSEVPACNPSPLCPPTHTFTLSLSFDTDLCQPACFRMQ